MRILAIALLASILVATTPARADDANQLMLSVGAFDLFHEGAEGTQGTRPIGAAEIRFGRKLWLLTPLLGLAATGGGAVFGYGGLGLDVDFDQWSLLPAASVGGYRQGDGKQLHSNFLFEGELTVARRLGNTTRVGITLAHISNGYRHGTDRRLNPGAEMLLLTMLFSLGG